MNEGPERRTDTSRGPTLRDTGRHPNDPSLEGESSRDDPERVREDARLAVERVAATISGIADGIVDGIERFHLIEETEEAMEQSRRLVGETSNEAQHQMQAPETQQFKQSARSAMERVRVPVRDRSGHAMERAREKTREKKEQLSERMDQQQGRVRDAAHKVQVKVRDGAESVSSRAHAIQETSRRSRVGLRSVTQQTVDAGGKMLQSVAVAAGGYVSAGLVGAIALVILSIGSVVGFNLLFGTPWGYFITTGIYIVGALAIAAGSRSAAESRRKEARQDMQEARQTVRHVAEPMRTAFGHSQRERISQRQTTTVAPRTQQSPTDVTTEERHVIPPINQER